MKTNLSTNGDIEDDEFLTTEDAVAALAYKFWTERFGAREK